MNVVNVEEKKKTL